MFTSAKCQVKESYEKFKFFFRKCSQISETCFHLLTSLYELDIVKQIRKHTINTAYRLNFTIKTHRQ